MYNSYEKKTLKNRLKDAVNSLIQLSQEEDYDDDDEMQLQEERSAEGIVYI